MGFPRRRRAGVNPSANPDQCAYCKEFPDRLALRLEGSATMTINGENVSGSVCIPCFKARVDIGAVDHK